MIAATSLSICDAATPEAIRKAAKHNSLSVDNSCKRLKDRNMNGYEPSTPRAALGLTAVAMATITMGALVVLPAKLGSVRANPDTLAATNAATKAPIEVATSRACIDVPEVVNREERIQPVARLSGPKNSTGNATN